VSQLTLASKKYRAVSEEMQGLRSEARRMMEVLKAKVDEDSQAFDKVMKAMKLPKLSDQQKAERREALQQAFKQAAEVPASVVGHCCEVVPLVEAVARRGNQASLSDAGVASLMCSACAEGAAMNVMINLGSIEDSDFRASLKARVSKDLETVRSGLAPVLAEIRSKLEQAVG
jgi:formiminotetrahydrofolate cyclodeaminase